jgi:hypothetical protein
MKKIPILAFDPDVGANSLVYVGQICLDGIYFATFSMIPQFNFGIVLMVVVFFYFYFIG